MCTRACDGMPAERPKVRATGILVKDGEIALVKQVLRERTRWNLPGGALEAGETLGECLVREMREETGLRVEVGELLYVCDRFKELKGQVLDISFFVTCLEGGRMTTAGSAGGGERLDAALMVPIDDLERYGFSGRFAQLAREGFPGKGSYRGDFHEFYG